MEAIRANPARQLLVGGTADDLWDADVAASLASDRVDVLQLDGLDHVLLDRADPVRSAEALVDVTRAMVRFLGFLSDARRSAATLSAGSGPASRRRCWRGRRRGPRSRPA